MALEKQARLVKALLEKTRAGAIEWRQSVPDDSFQVSFKDNSAEISRVYREDQEEPDYLITLYNAQGSIAEQFSDADLHRENPSGVPGGWFKLMAELFVAARRAALGSDKLLDEILREIDDDMPF